MSYFNYLSAENTFHISLWFLLWPMHLCIDSWFTDIRPRTNLVWSRLLAIASDLLYGQNVVRPSHCSICTLKGNNNILQSIYVQFIVWLYSVCLLIFALFKISYWERHLEISICHYRLVCLFLYFSFDSFKLCIQI